MKEYHDYYIKYFAKVFTPDAPPNSITEGFLFFGIRFQGLLLEKQGTYDELGFYKVEDIMRECDVDITGLPTLLKISTYSDAGRLGLTRELAFTLQQKDPTKEIYPFNSKYNTTLPYDSSLDVRKIASFLYDQTFTLGLTADTAEYVIAPNSIVDKKAKRTTARY
jgi:hypothetical protein